MAEETITPPEETTLLYFMTERTVTVEPASEEEAV